MKLEDKVAVVTGGASGIGRATARLFAAEGARVVATDLNADKLAEAADGHPGITTEVLDVTDSAAVRTVFDRVDEEFGRLDVLVNCAGINAPSAEANQLLIDTNIAALAAMKRGETPHFDFLEDTSDEDFRRTMEVNLFSQFYCLRAAAPLLKRNGGSVVNVSSVAALLGVAMPLYYPASKAGVLGLTRAAAAELAPYGIRVNAVCPGGVDTPLMHQQPADVVAWLTGMQPIARLAAPEELARTILFLAGEDGSYYTGQTISPNGGVHM